MAAFRAEVPGIGRVRAVRMFKTNGNDAVQVMAENLYRLARDIRGIGFRTADAIAARLGINHALLEASGAEGVPPWPASCW